MASKEYTRQTRYDELKRQVWSQKECKIPENSTQNRLESIFVSIVNVGVEIPVKPCNYSSWLKLKRVMAWIYQFTDNCGKQREERMTGELQADEMKRTELQLILHAQMTEFRRSGKHCQVKNLYHRIAS